MKQAHTLIRKTIHVVFFTFLSRFAGLIRLLLMPRYLGVGVVSDAFLTAFRIPNMLRKIFAEGALSAAVTPTLVHIVRHEGIQAASKLVSLLFLCIESVLLTGCSLIVWYAREVIIFVVPGFTPEQQAIAIPLLHILIFFIFFISSSAIFAGALQAVGHFAVPAAGQILLNLVTILGLICCITFKLPPTTLAWFIIAGGAVQLIAHLIVYTRLHFSFTLPTRETCKPFWQAIRKFLPCLVSISPIEILGLIDGQFASYLREGSVTRISYASDFMRIPLGFVIAFSTIMLPHLSRISAYAPKRLHFYLLESTKLIFWVTIPAILIMSFFAHDIFYTIFLSDRFTLTDVQEVSQLLIAALTGLFFFSLNKILLSMFYALHATTFPALITAVALLCNIGLNMLLMPHWGTLGLVIALSLYATISTVLFLVGLRYLFNFRFYMKRFFSFVIRYCIQLGCILTPAYYAYRIMTYALRELPPYWSHFFLQSKGLWLWVAPLCACAGLMIFFTRQQFGIQLYFLKQKKT